MVHLTPALLLSLSTVLGETTLASADRSPIELCIAPIQSKGFPAATREATRRALLEQLAPLGGIVPERARQIALEPTCLEEPECARRALAPINIVGALELQIIRVGPFVRARVRFYDAATGVKTLEVESTTPAKGFPAGFDQSADLERGLDILRELHPELEEKAAPSALVTSAPADEKLAERSTTELVAEAGSEGGASHRSDPAVGVNAAPRSVEDDEDDEIWPYVGWGATGVGALLLAGGAVAGALWAVRFSELEELCGRDRDCTDTGAQDRDKYDEIYPQFLFTSWTTPFLLGGGLLASAGGVTTLLLLPTDDSEDSEPAFSDRGDDGLRATRFSPTPSTP